MNIDYSMCNAFRMVHPAVNEAVALYDVMCQWSKKFPLRMQSSPSLQSCIAHLPGDFRMVKGIGLFHIHGHQASCLPRYSPDFIQGVGIVDGEIIETLWSGLNEVTRGTRGMSGGHRQEVIDDHMGYSNWMKLVRISQYQFRQHLIVI